MNYARFCGLASILSPQNRDNKRAFVYLRPIQVHKRAHTIKEALQLCFANGEYLLISEL